MRVGEIVRCVNPGVLDRSAFRIIDAQPLCSRAHGELDAIVYDIGDGLGLDHTADELELLTVSDLFREAGFPIEEEANGARLQVAFRDNDDTPFIGFTTGPNDYTPSGWFWFFDDGERGWDFMELSDCCVFAADLSRLPAADMWECLPDSIKAVVR